VRSANGAADTVFPTLFGLSSQETQVGPKLPDIGSGQKRKFEIQRNFGKALFLSVQN